MVADGPSDIPDDAATAPADEAEVVWEPWREDVFLPGYQARTMRLVGARRYPEEGEGELTASLVRRNKPSHSRAVLYIHGWNDYFFQTHLADVWDTLGYDFYALDLRRYGRALHDGELAGYIDDLADYDLEIDAAVKRVRRHHETVVINAHSTGGLTAALWADRHPGVIAGLVLNSPWIDLQASSIVRAVAPTIIRSLASRVATRALPWRDNGNYARALHTSLGGDWDWDLAVKTSPSQPVRAGWLRAVMGGHAQIAAGIDIDCPVLMLISARSDFRRDWSDDFLSADTVLDVKRLAARAANLGRHVTLVRLDGAMHDVVLSAEPVRERAFDEMRRWSSAYVR